jgi:uncharacterized membrane protein YgdD (TMEM256/DUF423 family)
MPPIVGLNKRRGYPSNQMIMSGDSEAMKEEATWPIRVAAGVAFLGVLLGAFGAHALKDKLAANGAVDSWDTGVFYQMVHAVVLFVLALHGRGGSGAWYCLLVGVICFSGSIYLLALKVAPWLWPVTPLGGVLLMAGWVWLVFARWRRD